MDLIKFGKKLRRSEQQIFQGVRKLRGSEWQREDKKRDKQ